MPTYRYPLNDQYSYSGLITFRPIKYQPPKISEDNFSKFRKKFLNDDTLTSFTSRIEGASTIEAARSAAVAAEANEALGLQSPTLDGPQEKTFSGSVKTVDRTNGVKLYLPSAIQIQDSVRYENINLGIVGGIANEGIQQGSGIAASVAAGINQATGSMVDVLRGNFADQRAARLGATRLASIGGEKVQSAARNALATTINPNTISMFNSVNLRTFSFTFKMIATSRKEAAQIDNIIKFFRETMYPDAINLSEDIPVPVGYEFPDKFEITMTYKGKQVGVKILPSVLTSVQTNLNATAQAWHSDSKPTEVDISLTFGEERTLTKQDIQGGY